MTAVSVSENGTVQQWTLEVDDRPDSTSLSVKSPDGRSWASSADNVWEALLEVRRQLEGVGVRLGVNGARPDVQPSRMSLQMGGGRMAYQVKLGHQATGDLVDVLAPCPVDAVVTVEEQQAFRIAWMQSLG